MIGNIVKTRFGDVGKVIEIITLRELALRKGEDVSREDEWDLPYFVCQLPTPLASGEGANGIFEICQYECERC